jgi:hypothetical protein
LPVQAVYWQRYAEAELRAGNAAGVRAIFSRCLLACLAPDLWATYLRFIKQVATAAAPD